MRLPEFAELVYRLILEPLYTSVEELPPPFQAAERTAGEKRRAPGGEGARLAAWGKLTAETRTRFEALVENLLAGASEGRDDVAHLILVRVMNKDFDPQSPYLKPWQELGAHERALAKLLRVMTEACGHLIVK